MDFVDVAIVGGGVMGSATAYYLHKHGFKGSVAIIEKDTTYAYSCTARSAGGMRQQFSCPENIRLSQFGLALIDRLKDEFGPDSDVGFREHGYLILASPGGEDVLRANVELQSGMGAGTVLLAPEEMKTRFPWLALDGLGAGSFGTAREGWIDPTTLMNLLRKAAQRSGTRIIADEVVGVERGNGRIVGLSLKNAGPLGVGTLVNAAGAGAGELARMAGADLPVGPRKRYVYVLDCPVADDALRAAPLTVDPEGFYFRPEGRHFLSGLSPGPHEEPEPLDWEVDYAWFEERIWPGLAARVPAFETVKVINAWVGHYDYNAFDENGIIGRHPGIPNLYFANGFSGHGLQQGPAAGNALAELIVHGRYIAIDLERMGYDRILRREPYGERNVI